MNSEVSEKCPVDHQRRCVVRIPGGWPLSHLYGGHSRLNYLELLHLGMREDQFSVWEAYRGDGRKKVEEVFEELLRANLADFLPADFGDELRREYEADFRRCSNRLLDGVSWP